LGWAFAWVRRQNLADLLSILAVLLGLWGFIGLAAAVHQGNTQKVDEWLLRALRQREDPANPLGPVWLEESVRDITALGGVPVLALVVAGVSGFLLIRGQYSALGLLLAALISGGLLNMVLKDLFDRPRPVLVPHLLRVGNASFPSGHAMLSAVVYLTLGAFLGNFLKQRRFKVYALGLALAVSCLIGITRVYLGVHYPTDVLAGWTVGVVWALLWSLAAHALQRRGHVEPAE